VPAVRVSERATRCAIEPAQILLRGALFGVLVWISAGLSFAQQTSQNTDSGTPQMTPEVPPRASGAPVEIDGRPILMVYSSVAGIAPEERAANIQQRILGIANRKAIQPDAIHAEDRGAWTEIRAGNEMILRQDCQFLQVSWHRSIACWHWQNRRDSAFRLSACQK